MAYVPALLPALVLGTAVRRGTSNAGVSRGRRRVTHPRRSLMRLRRWRSSGGSSRGSATGATSARSPSARRRRRPEPTRLLGPDAHPPADGLHAYIHAPLRTTRTSATRDAGAASLSAASRSSRRVSSVARCATTSVRREAPRSLERWAYGGLAPHEGALEQRFPNPTPAAFRHRVALVGRRFGFHVVSLRLLRPNSSRRS